MKTIGNILWGIIFIAVGVVLAGNTMGFTNINIFFDGWWTLFIIIPSFIGLFTKHDRVGSIIGLLIGIALLLASWGWFDFDIVLKLIFPIILVVIGLSFIFKDTFADKNFSKLKEGKEGFSEHCATFGGQNVKFDGEEFCGTNLTAVFGGVECDLNGSIINEDSLINATSIFGGIRIFPPKNVKVKIKSVPIFACSSNKFENSSDKEAKTIYINATCIFGGIEIK